jgi:PAS domain S-box-containing protein
MAGTEMIPQDLLHDTKRLSAVSEYLPIVAGAFSRVARSAARATGMPFGLVCILDDQDIHFKGMYGLELRQTKRALPDNVSLLIPERFSQTNQPQALNVLNQLFSSRSGWQKYFFAFQASVPLRGADGHVLGALVVLDEQIRELDMRDVAILEDCAEALVAELDLRRQIASLEERRNQVAEIPEVQAVSSLEMPEPDESFDTQTVKEEFFQFNQIADTSPIAMVAETLDGTITYWNASAQRMLGYSQQEVIGQKTSLLIPAGRTDLPLDELELLLTGQFYPIANTLRLHSTGQQLPVRVSFAPILDAQGTVVGISSALELNTPAEPNQNQSSEVTGLPALVFSINIDGFFTSCHGAPLLEVLNDHAQVIGQTCFQVLESQESLLEAICVGLLGEEFEFSFQNALVYNFEPMCTQCLMPDCPVEFAA